MGSWPHRIALACHSFAGYTPYIHSDSRSDRSHDLWEEARAVQEAQPGKKRARSGPCKKRGSSRTLFLEKIPAKCSIVTSSFLTEASCLSRLIVGSLSQDRIFPIAADQMCRLNAIAWNAVSSLVRFQFLTHGTGNPLKIFVVARNHENLTPRKRYIRNIFKRKISRSTVFYRYIEL